MCFINITLKFSDLLLGIKNEKSRGSGFQDNFTWGERYVCLNHTASESWQVKVAPSAREIIKQIRTAYTYMFLKSKLFHRNKAVIIMNGLKIVDVML